MKKAFTIVELLVAVALLAILMAISGLVFSAAVRAYRTAGAASEIAAKLQVMTQQLDDDLRGLRKDGEFSVVWSPGPEYAIKDGQFVDINNDGTIPDPIDNNGDGIPDRYLSFDRLYFFTNGNFQTYNEQPVTIGSPRIVQGDNSVARICYSFGRDGQDTRAPSEPNPDKRLFCRTQHIISANADLPLFPDMSVGWNAADFETKNSSYEYQTMDMQDWLNIPMGNPNPIKDDILSMILDVRVSASSITAGGPKVDTQNATTLHQLFMQGVGQFHVQMWVYDPVLSRYRWYPEIDPDGDGIYNEGLTFDEGRTDYNLVGNELDTVNIDGRLVPQWYSWDDIGPALKFTFTLYDSNGVFKNGKTFTHIVYLNN